MTLRSQSVDSITAVEAAMHQVVRQAFFEAPFFQALAEGRLSRAQLRHFAIQYAFYSALFPRVLAAAIAALAPYEDWWIPLADNLWDEAGRGQAGRSHGALYRTFLASVDPSLPYNRHGLPDVPVSPAVTRTVESYVEFFRRADPLAAMAAVGLGSELFAGSVMGFIGNALQQRAYQSPRPLDTRFWAVHADTHEPRHWLLCRSVLVRETSPAGWPALLTVGVDIAEAEAAMYTALYEESPSPP